MAARPPTAGAVGVAGSKVLGLQFDSLKAGGPTHLTQVVISHSIGSTDWPDHRFTVFRANTAGDALFIDGTFLTQITTE